MSLLAPVPALEQYVSYGLSSLVALALVDVGLVDCMQVSAQADLASAHLCDDRAYCSVCANMGVECCSSWLYAKSEELSTMLGRFPG